METETKSLVFVSEDEGTASDPIDQKNSGATVEELEEEIRELEKTLKRERSERRRIQASAQEEVEREVIKAEEVWMERARQAIQERDALSTRTQQMEEQLDSIRLDVNRAVAYRMEMEESRNRMKTQLELVQRDYEETMMERSTVLEENQRLTEERDHLRRTIHSLNKTVEDLAHRVNTTEVDELKRKLEQSRRQLAEETTLATRRQGEIVDQMTRLGEQLRQMTAERDEAQRRLQDSEEEREQIVDIWMTHTVDMALPFPKPNLGIVLSGGRSDDRLHSPVYVKDVLSGSPLEQVVRKLDHILMVNDIDVTEMDQRSVIDILKNSHHLSLVIRRRANEHKIHEVTFSSNHELGIELGNGVFVNSVELGGTASRNGIIPGSRLVHVNHVPVYDAKHAEQMIKYTSGALVLGVLDGKKRNEAKETKQRTIFSKLFGRHNTEKPRPVVAKATIVPEGSSFLRQGSLRIPASQPAQLVRYGSLRAPPGSMEGTRFSEHLEHIINKSNSPRLGAHSDNSPWPKTVAEEVVPRRRVHRPSVFPIFANSPATSRHSRQSVEVSSPSPWSPREGSRPVMRRPSYERRAVTSPIHSHYSERLSCYSPALPQPPPYPGPRDESLSSLLSSTNSLPVPGPSTYHNYTNNSPSGTLLSESSDKVRRVHLSREGNEFGLGLENHNGGGVVISNVQGRTSGIVRRGDRLLDVGGINMRSADKDSAVKVLNQFGASQDETLQVAILVASSLPRWIQIPRKSIKLCGGNAIGILAEASAGDLQEGDLILEIDGFNVRGATLEEATEALLESLSEMADLLIEDGGDRLNRLRLGADGDAVYVRVNVDRNSENKDELDIRAGEIVFVDKTVFMGQRGRWRAWKMDREGRQRENGIIPSATQMEAIEQKKKGKARAILSRAIYERMERVCSSKRRPVVLFGPLFAPFVQALLDDSTKFAQVVPECKALQPLEVERQLHCCELIEARRRDKLFDVISASSITNVADQGLHCIVDLSPAAIKRIHQLRIYPILIRLKFKSAKQVKDMKEDFEGEKLSSKAAKELIDKAAAIDSELEQLGLQATVIQINSQGPTRTVLKHVCQQICAHVDHEQKKTIWVTMNC